MPVYVVDKPLHATSHDVVAQARRLLGTRRVGHGGTLDPLASGVLALLVDDGTKLSPFLTDSRKRYVAWVSFGATTATLDAEGPLLAGPSGKDVDGESIERALPDFLALSEQVPPQYSAVKRQGVKGYEAARKGERLDLPARPAGYHRIDLLAFAAERDALPDRVAFSHDRWLPHRQGRAVPLPDPLGVFPTALISLEVRAGTYVRSFARDLGEAVGAPAFLSGLLRTGAGPLDLAMAVPPSRMLESSPVAAADALSYPRITLDSQQVGRVRQGQRLPVRLNGRTALVDGGGDLVAVAEIKDGRMTFLRVWGGH
ncbi:MAG: tRNA pseudouridine(55) synthase TruB [Trueperaceae bacterium]